KYDLEDVHTAFPFPDDLRLKGSKIDDRGRDVIAVSSINDYIHQIIPLFVNKLGISGVFHYLIIILDRGRNYGISQLSYYGPANIIVRHPDTHSLFLFEDAGQVVVSRQDEGIGTRQVSLQDLKGLGIDLPHIIRKIAQVLTYKGEIGFIQLHSAYLRYLFQSRGVGNI